MKKALTIGAAVAAIAFSSSPADAHASSEGYSVGRDPATYTDGGYTVVIDRSRGRKMHCSSVRYVINRWIRRKVARQSGHPHLFGPFFDGYVTWHCWKRSRLQVQCDEYTSNTSLRFRGRVY